jgi:dTDP-4-amino-4,6-dideoxygalactose transaminase
MSRQAATFGAKAFAGLAGKLPTPFPRIMGPNAGAYVQEVVDGGLAGPNMTDRFEAAFAAGLGVRHCIGTPGCTPALQALAAAFPFAPGDEIIVSPVTDYGSLLGLLAENYVPVFADTMPGTINMGAPTIAPCITDRTRAILVVHMTGLMCDMDPIMALAAEHGLVVYEDACQAVFSTYKGRPAGSIGHAAAFSFDSEKTLGADQGGCVVTDDDELAERVRFLGISRGGVEEPGFGRVHTHMGYAYRMPQCTAAVTLAQYEIVHDHVARIDEMARYLTSLLTAIPGITPLPIPTYQETYSCWMFGLNIEAAAFRCGTDAFAAQLAEAGIPGAGPGRYYLMPAALRFLQEQARGRVYPFCEPATSRLHSYAAENTPVAWDFLATFIRWSTFCERYTRSDCELAAEIVHRVAEANRV